MLSLSALVAVLGVVAASTIPAGDVCAPIPASDSACGFMAGVNTVLTPGQAAGIATSYVPLLASLCPAVKDQAANFPVVLCLGGVGPCNNADFVLPEANADGTPKDLVSVGKFYNEAKFAQVLPALAAAGVLPPCYELCYGVAKSILTCSALKFLNASADPCQGLPLSASGKCVNSIGPGNAAVSVPASMAASPTSAAGSVPAVAPSTAASTAATTGKTGSGSGASTITGSVSLLVLAAAFVVLA